MRSSFATFYKWRAKFGGMEASDVKRLRELEAENCGSRSCWPRPCWTARR
ncbi:transposase [Hylemonella sp. W303a]